MKERKLFTLCFSFLIISFFVIQFGGKYFLQELRISKTEEIISSGSWVKAVGQLYRKEKASDYQILYLKNISITYQNQSIKESQIIIYNKDKNVKSEIGNRIIVSGPLKFFEPAANPGNFDQKFYYQRQNIRGYIWSNTVEVNKVAKFAFRNILYELRMTWCTYLKEAAGEKYGGILEAMLLGEKTSMDEEIKELYQVNGIAHILAISGLHLSFIGHSFYQFIRRGTGSYLAGGITGLIFMTLYIMMIGASISALRAVVMFVLRVMADMSGRVYDPPTAVSLAAVIVILWRPLSFYDGGFQLSFGAMIGVLFLNPLISFNKKNKSFLNNLIIASLSIQIITLPILLYHYYEFPLYSVLLNLIVVPLMSVVLLLSAFGVLCGMIWEPCAEVLVCGSVWILKGYEWLCDWVLEFPNARIVTGRPALVGVIIYYLFVGVVMGIYHLARNTKRKGVVWIVALSLGSFALFMSCPHTSNNELKITMLDIGQGDCFFVQQGEFTCLIDGGSSSESRIAKYRIEPFLKYNGVSELDYVFVSHGDVDHISGIQEMLERQREGVRIKTLVMPEQSVWDEALWELAKLSNESGVKVVTIHAGESLQKEELKIKCLYPEDEEQGITVGNETSMVLEISYLDFNMLFTGDIEKDGEEKLTSLLRKKYDALKIAHHGSKTSTSEMLLDEVNPKIGLISAGVNNSYGHPHEETLERLRDAGCKVWNTAESGAVSILVKKESIFFVRCWRGTD